VLGSLPRNNGSELTYFGLGRLAARLVPVKTRANRHGPVNLVNPVLSGLLANHFALNHNANHMRRVLEWITIIQNDVAILARF
jgi:hypothetical protein